MAYDEKCYELAAYFLSDPRRVDWRKPLAEHIQRAIEDWLEAEDFANQPVNQI